MSDSLVAGSHHDRLIASSRVSGTAVYDTDGGHIGRIDDVMIDKPSGRIAYAVLSFGGFLGIGDKQHPLPWGSLRYDTRLDGYVVNLDRHLLEGAPAYSETAFDDRGWGRVDDYYGTPRLDAETPLSATSIA